MDEHAGWGTGDRFCPEAGGGGEVVQIMYTHVSKYKNDKIKKEPVHLLSQTQFSSVQTCGTAHPTNR
jgi:hypothetical protein